MIDALIREVRQVCALGIARGCEAEDQLPTVIEAIDQQGAARSRPASNLSQVECHLARAISSAMGTENEALAAGIFDCSDRFVWKDVTSDYGDAPSLDAFIENFAYTVIMGPDRLSQSNLIACETIFLGFSLQAPNTFYPPHAHDAVEVYYVISGTAAWQRGSEDWKHRPPGSFILHRSGVSHAMQTLEEPLLSLFIWVSDLGSKPRLVRT